MDPTAAARPRSAGVTRLDEEDEETDKLGEEGDKELEVHKLQGCGEHGQNDGGASPSSSSPSEPSELASEGSKSDIVTLSDQSNSKYCRTQF